MAVNKIYQDSVIAGGSIRDGQGKRIDTTYAKKSDIPDAYTKTEVNNLLVDKADVEDIPAPYILPMASVDTLGGVKVDNTTIGIDSNGVISSKVPLDTEKLTMSYADETLTFSYPDTSYGVVTFDLTPTNGTLEVTTPAIKKATNMYKVVKNRDITYNYTAQGYNPKSGTVNITEDTTITIVLEASASSGGGGGEEF